MADTAPLPAFAAIVVAAGKGLRVGGDTPKQFRTYRGKPLIRHSIESLLAAGAAPTVWQPLANGAAQPMPATMRRCLQP